MPLIVVRFSIGHHPPTRLEVLILDNIGLYAAGRFQSHDWHPQRTLLEIPIALLLIAGVIGIGISSYHAGALGIYRAYFIEPIALFYVAIALLQPPPQFRVLLLGIPIGATVFALMT